MTTEKDISETLTQLKDSAPAGYALAFHIRYTTPTFLFQTYPKAWSDYYSQNGLVMQDPTVAWGFEHLGTKRWSELAENDPAGVMAKAAEYGLKFGVTVAIEVDESRSISSFARADREFSDTEVAELRAAMEEIHVLTGQIKAISPEMTQNLRKIAINVGTGAG